MAILHPEKIGIGAFEGGDPYDPPGGIANYYTASYDSIIFNNAIKNVGFRWYHTWHPYSLTGDDGSVKRLPAWWQPGDLTPEKLNAMQANGNIIIGTNEPWSGNFGMTVDDTIAVWPTLMTVPNRLASPSTGGEGPNGLDWLADFMNKINLHGYRCDLINVHWYTTNTNPTTAVANFKDYLTNLYNLYNRPIIITEWAMAAYPGPGTSHTEHAAGVPPPFTYAQQIAFMQAAVQMLDTLDFVELHAWYATTNDGAYYENNNIINGNGLLTPLGQAFNDLFTGVITPPPPPSHDNKDIRGTKAGVPGSYFEVVFNTLNTGSEVSGVGVANLSQPLSGGRPGDPNAVMYYANGYAEWPGSGDTNTWASYGVGDIIGVFYKPLTVEFYKNGVLAGIASVEPGGTLYPILSFANNSDSATANFGATEMNFLPAGATSWDGILTSGGRHAAASQILPALQQISGAVGAAPAILNPNDKSVNLLLSNGNLTVISNSANGMVRGTRPGVANRYFEFTFSSIGGGGVGIGVANLTQSLAGYMGDPNGVGYFSTGYSEWPASGFDDVFATFTAGDVIGVHLKASTVDFYKNGTLAGTATALPSGVLYPAVLLVSTGDRGTVNFGASSFLSLPAGATAWSASISSSDHTALVTQILGSLGQTITATTGTGGTAGITLNPADKFTNIVLSNANLRATYTTSRPSQNVNVRGNTAGGPDNYFEVVFSTLVSSTSGAGIGVANLSQSLSAYPGDPNGIGWFSGGYAEWPGSGYSNNFGSFAAGDVLGVCLRSSSVEFYKNGTLVGTATALPTGALYPIISPANNTDSATVNFGASAFSFAPSGALPWGHFNVGGYVCDGDSLTRGAAQDGVPVVSYPTQLAGITSLPVANMGIDGQSMATMDANYAANIAPLFNASTANVLILEGGGNDLPGGGTATTIGASVRSYCAKARATGFKVFLMTMPPININNDARIDAINADRRSTWSSYCDGLIDIAADPAFSDVGNRTYYQTDNTHWRTAADTVVANLVKVATLGP